MGLRKLAVVPVVVLGFFVLAPAASAWIANACLSIGGHTIYSSGSVTCETTSGHNVAAAIGENSGAVAIDGNNNTALVFGDGAQAKADGDGNTALTFGDGSTAYADYGGNNNTAVVHGDGSGADAGFGENADGNTAVVHGDGSSARAGDGNGNTAVVHGDNSKAEAFEGNNNTAAAKDNSTAVALSGDGNTAVAKHDSTAFADTGSGNTALAAHGGYACAGINIQLCVQPCLADATVECTVTINPANDPDNNTAIALYDGMAFAGGIGGWDWNKAVAIGGCIAEALGSSGNSDFCGPHHNNVTP